MPDQNEIKYLYENWLNEIRKRGTSEISRMKGGFGGLCLYPDQIGFNLLSYKNYDLGNRYSVEVDIKIEYEESSRYGWFFGNTDSDKIGSNPSGFLFSCNVEEENAVFSFFEQNYTYTGEIGVTRNIKLVRDITNFYVFIDGVNVFSLEGVLTEESDVINIFARYDTPKFANIKIDKPYLGEILYGKLYNHHALENLYIPDGWKILDFSGWSSLRGFIGGIGDGYTLKSSGSIQEGTGLWDGENISTDIYGFSAHPNGIIYKNGFADKGKISYFIFKHESTGLEYEVYIENDNPSLIIAVTSNIGYGGGVRLYSDDPLYSTGDVIYDIDGNKYDVVVLGGIAYTVQNYACSRNFDGSVIPTVDNGETWAENYYSGLPSIANYDNLEVGNTFKSGFSINLPLNEDGFYFREPGGEYLARVEIENTQLLPNILTSNFIQVDEDFNNSKHNEVDGELSRLLGRKVNDEHLVSLVEKEGLGFVLNTSSPMSKQTYPIINLNKFRNKNRDIIDLSGVSPYLVMNEDNDLIEVDRLRIDEFTFPGEKVLKMICVNGFSTGFNYVGADKSVVYGSSSYDKKIIPVDRSLDYEVSLRVYLDYDYEYDLNLDSDVFRFDFGVNTYNQLGNFSPNQMKQASTGVFNNSFTKDLVFWSDQWAYQRSMSKRWVWFRGLILKEGTSHDSKYSGLNLNLENRASHLIFGSNVEFIQPYLIIPFDQSYTYKKDMNVYVKDIQVRPVELPTPKGQVGVKNPIINYLKDNSGMTKPVIDSILEKELLPYNCVTKTKYI